MSYYGKSSGSSAFGIVWCVIVAIVLLFSFSRSCTEQSITKNWGGTMEMELEPNKKLVEVTWKDDSLWILTKDMVEDDIVETYTFAEKDVSGWLEGTVIIKEVKLEGKELEKYNEQKVLAEDFYKYGNVAYDSETGEGEYVFITYNAENDTYTKIKDYSYTSEYEENDTLVEER